MASSIRNATTPMSNKSIIYLVLGLSPVLNAGADNPSTRQLPEGAGLDGYLHTAITNSPALFATYARYHAAVQAVTRSRSLPDPQVSYTHFFEQIETRTGPQERAVTLSQTIPWPDKLRLRAGAARHHADAAFEKLQSLRLNLSRQVAHAYADYAYLGKLTDSVTGNIALLEQLAPVVREKVRAGGSLAQSLKLDVELGKTRDQLRGLARQRAAASARLLALLALPDSTAPLPFPPLPSTTPTRPLPDSNPTPLAANPHLRSLDHKRLAAQKSLKLTHRDPVPDPTIGTNVIDIGSAGDTAVGITLGFKIPLWSKKYRAAQSAAAAQLDAATADIASESLRLTGELRTAIESYTDASQRAKLYRDELLPTARQALELAHQAYRGGTASLLDVIDAERTLLDLETVLWRAIADAHKHTATAKTLAGQQL